MSHLHVRLWDHAVGKGYNRTPDKIALRSRHGLGVYFDLADAKRWGDREQYLPPMPTRPIPDPPTAANVPFASRTFENPHRAFGPMCTFVCAAGFASGCYAHG